MGQSTEAYPIHLLKRKKLSSHEFNNLGKAGLYLRDYDMIVHLAAKAGIQPIIKDSLMHSIINIAKLYVVKLIVLLRKIESALVVKANIEQVLEKAGDIPITYSDISKVRNLLGCQPTASLNEGLVRFKEWLLKQDN